MTMRADAPVMAIHPWKNNAEMIRDCARLGYLHDEWLTLDPTWGKGNFWTKWRPATLIASDIVQHLSPQGYSVDFRDMPWEDDQFGAVVFDPPYKLNGTPSLDMDESYGVHIPARWQDRMALVTDGVQECARVLAPGGFLLVKCQDQVVSGQVRWQTDIVTAEAAAAGCEKVDRLDLLSYRPQPKGRRQVHARRNSSTLLVFRKGR